MSIEKTKNVVKKIVFPFGRALHRLLGKRPPGGGRLGVSAASLQGRAAPQLRLHLAVRLQVLKAQAKTC